jgi:acyl-CoA synthetase (AMP-forming)/AMP-acid ligase II
MAWGGGGRGLSNTSFAHVGYMTKLPQTLRSGTTTYLMKRWTAGDAIELVQRHRITTLGGIPTQMELMLRHESFEKADLSSVALVVLGGAQATSALVRETRKRLGVPVVVRYTCTEAGVGTGTEIDDPPEAAEETVGKARPGVEVSVRDDADRPLAHDEVGHVCLSSAAVMSGYYRNEEATAAAFTADGAVRTGDMGFFDESGRLHLTGRSSEMFVRGGYNVFPAEVEDALCDHPLIAHVAVAPRPDPVMGEIGVAVVVARRGEEPPTLESLRDHAHGRLASYKLPEGLMIVTELPRTAMDKVDRRALVEFVRTNPEVGRP